MISYNVRKRTLKNSLSSCEVHDEFGVVSESVSLMRLTCIESMRLKSVLVAISFMFCFVMQNNYKF